VATFITTAAVYLVVVLAGLSAPRWRHSGWASCSRCAGRCGDLTWRTTTPTALLAFHQRFAALRRGRTGGCRSLVVTMVALAVAVGPQPHCRASAPWPSSRWRSGSCGTSDGSERMLPGLPGLPELRAVRSAPPDRARDGRAAAQPQSPRAGSSVAVG